MVIKKFVLGAFEKEVLEAAQKVVQKIYTGMSKEVIITTIDNDGDESFVIRTSHDIYSLLGEIITLAGSVEINASDEVVITRDGSTVTKSDLIEEDKFLKSTEQSMAQCIQDSIKDPEEAHVTADQILADYIKIRCPEAQNLLELYEQVRKWYS